MKLKELYPTAVELLQQFCPKRGNSFLSKWTKGDIASSDIIPSIALVRAAYGENLVKAWINNHLYDLLDYAETQQGTTDEKVEELADLIQMNYYYLNLAEIMYFCAEVKLGRYGKFYGTTGPMQLADMLNQYIKARNAEISSLERFNNTQRIIALHEGENGYKAYLSSLQAKASQGDENAKRLLLKHKQL